MDYEDFEQEASERIVDLSKAISGIEGKKIQTIAFKIYNARKEAWERVRSIKLEYGGRRIHDELQSHLESFLDKKKEEKKIDVEQIQIFKNTQMFAKQPPSVDLYKIDDRINIERGLSLDMTHLKTYFQRADDSSDSD